MIPAPQEPITNEPSVRESCAVRLDPATTQISTFDTRNGVAIQFTTTGNVRELRKRVHQIADAHNEMSMENARRMQSDEQRMQDLDSTQEHDFYEQEDLQQQRMPEERSPGPQPQIVESHASVQDIRHGARLVIVPDDPLQIDEVRQEARMRADMIQHGECATAALPTTEKQRVERLPPLPPDGERDIFTPPPAEPEVPEDLDLDGM